MIPQLRVPKILIVLACTTTLLAQPRPKGPLGSSVTQHVYPGRTGLTMIAFAEDGFALAADGAQRNADGTTSQTQKLFKVGKNGAVIFAGSIPAQDPVARRIREEFNPERVAVPWLNAHKDAEVDAASSELGSVIEQAANHYFSKRTPGKSAGSYKFAVIFVGYVNGKPFFSGNRYFLASEVGKLMRVEALPAELKPGEAWILGLAKVEQSLASGNSPALKKFADQPAIKKFHSNKPEELAARDYADFFAAILHATESEEGKKFAPGRSLIGGPDRVAVINKDGFEWGQ